MSEEEAGQFMVHFRRWRATIGDQTYPVGVPVRLESPFGSVEIVAVPKPDETGVRSDSIAVRRAPNVHIVAWGLDPEGYFRILIIDEQQPLADDPMRRDTNGHSPVVFATIPKGFINDGETPEDAARRRLSQEAKAAWRVLNVTRPFKPFTNPEPAYVVSWSDIVFVELDIGDMPSYEGKSEVAGIQRWRLYTHDQVLSYIAAGEDDQGASWCDARMLAAFQKFNASRSHGHRRAGPFVP